MELNLSYQVTRFIYVCAIDSVIVNWKYIIIIIIIATNFSGTSRYARELKFDTGTH